MTAAATQRLASPRAVPRGFGAGIAAGLVLVASFLLHWRHGTVGDVSWLITVDEKWLNGATPYRDVIEINPPASLILYWPSIAFARLVGLAPETAVAAFGYVSAALSLGLAAALLGAARVRCAPFALVALAAALILTGVASDERDVLAGYYALPFVALAALRAEARPVATVHAVLAGLLFGAAVAIKPPYALIALCAAPALLPAFREGLRALLPEAISASAVVALYAAVVVFAFPHYVSDVLPIGVAIYAPIRENLLKLALSPDIVPAALMAGSYFLRPRRADALATALALAALGAFLAFIVQGKGWSYQAYPFTLFAALLGGLGLSARAVSARRGAGLIALAVVMAAAAVATARAPTPFALVAAFAWRFVADRAGDDEPPATLFEARLPLSVDALFAALFGAACGVFLVEGVHDAGMREALARVAPHPRVLSISESLAFGHPLVRSVGGEWVGTTPSMWIVAGARRLIAESGDDPKVVARLEPFIDGDRDRTAADILREKPDAILVGKLGTQFHDWAWSDDKLTAARKDYVFFAKNADPDWPAEIWVRRDLVGLRGALPSAE